MTSKYTIVQATIPSIFVGIESKDSLLALFKRLDPTQRQALLDYVEDVNAQNYQAKLGGEATVLYHGSPEAKIEQEGLKILKGQRSGFLGATISVQNQGIFMTDSKRMAQYFATNRADHPADARVYEAYVKIGKLLDLSDPTKIPPTLRKVGLSLMEKYEGKTKTKLAIRDIWKLLDQAEFVKAIKEAGYNTVRFKEEGHIKKGSGDAGASTYLVFDPNDILVKSPKNNKIQDLDDLVQHLRHLRG